jgi:hypothetical protein
MYSKSTCIGDCGRQESARATDRFIEVSKRHDTLVCQVGGRDFFAVSSAGLRNGSLGSQAIGVVSHSAGIQFIGANETMRTLALAYNVTLI